MTDRVEAAARSLAAMSATHRQTALELMADEDADFHRDVSSRLEQLLACETAAQEATDFPQGFKDLAARFGPAVCAATIDVTTLAGVEQGIDFMSVAVERVEKSNSLTFEAMQEIVRHDRNRRRDSVRSCIERGRILRTQIKALEAQVVEVDTVLAAAANDDYAPALALAERLASKTWAEATQEALDKLRYSAAYDPRSQTH
jgi:hypothetical protein